MAKSRKLPEVPPEVPKKVLTLDEQRAAAAAQTQDAQRRAQAVEGTGTVDVGANTAVMATNEQISDAIARAVVAEAPAGGGPAFRFPPTGPEGVPGYGYAEPPAKPDVRSYFYDQPPLTPEQMKALRDTLAAGRGGGLGNIPAPITSRAAGFDTGGLPDVRLADEAQLGGDFIPSAPLMRDFANRPTVMLADEPQMGGDFTPATPMQRDFSRRPLVRLADEPQMNMGLPPDKTLPLGLDANDIDYVDAGGSSPLPGDAARQKAAADAAAAAQKAQGAAGDSPIEPKPPVVPAAPRKSYAPSAILKRMGVAMRPGKLLKDYAWPVAREVGSAAILGTGAVLAPSAIARLAREYGPGVANWVKESWMPAGEQQATQPQPQAGQPAADPSYIQPPQQGEQGGPRPQYLENLRRSRYQIGDPNSSDIIRTLTQSRGMA